MASDLRHVPVLTDAVLHYLHPLPQEIHVDATVGAGGHAERLLEHADGSLRLIGIDRDPEALERAQNRLKRFGEAVTLVHGNFRKIAEILDGLAISEVDGVLLDLGVSSPQLDQPERGFRFRSDAPLDMRMDPTQGETAAELLASRSREELTRILREFGEERWASRIAQFIVETREKEPIRTTGQLTSLIRAAIPAGARRGRHHPARRTFQALRIAVNDELGALAEALEPAATRLRAGGRMVVISYHSLEDRIVKNTFRALSRECSCFPEKACSCGARGLLEILTKRPVRPAAEEIRANPRARSAKLRAARRRPAGRIGQEEGEYR